MINTVNDEVNKLLTANPYLNDTGRMGGRTFPTRPEKTSHMVQSACGNLIDYLKQQTHFDSLIILGYQNGSMPMCLYSSLKMSRDQSIKLLITSSYAYDPFYAEFISKSECGVYRTEDVLADQRTFTEYRRRFQFDNARQDELALCVPLDTNRRIVIFLRRNSIENGFSPEEKQMLTLHLESLYALCQEMWPSVWSATSDSSHQNLAEVINSSLSCFGADILSTREKEVVSLILQGHDNKAIADIMEISLATVKVHRKNVYVKFEISSLGELFQLFLNHLVLFSSQATFAHQHSSC